MFAPPALLPPPPRHLLGESPRPVTADMSGVDAVRMGRPATATPARAGRRRPARNPKQRKRSRAARRCQTPETTPSVAAHAITDDQPLLALRRAGTHHRQAIITVCRRGGNPPSRPRRLFGADPLASVALAVRLDGETRDLARPLPIVDGRAPTASALRAAGRRRGSKQTLDSAGRLLERDRLALGRRLAVLGREGAHRGQLHPL